jgi:hypothetical protein
VSQERPVASSKLNAWDDRIEAALELAFLLIGQAFGGSDGVLPGMTQDDLRVMATSTPGMSVVARTGYALIGRFPFRLTANAETALVTAPSAQPRIDLVQACLDTWTVGVKRGVEAAAPTAPVADAGCLALAKLYLRPGMTGIHNLDDGINGYIIDARVFF